MLGTTPSLAEMHTMETEPFEPPPADGKDAKPPMPKKDRLSLVLSTLSLAVSLGTLVLNRADVFKAEAKRNAVASYQAYELGDGIGRTFVSHAMTTLGDKQAIDQMKERLASHARQTVQPIADRLDLRIDISAKLTAYDPKDDVFSVRVIEDIRRDVEGTYGASVARKMMLGYQLFYLSANTFAVRKDYPQDKPKLANIYHPRAKAINEELARMEVSPRLPDELDSLDVVLSSLQSVSSAVRVKLAADRG